MKNQEQDHSVPLDSGENPKNAEIGMFGTILADDEGPDVRISISSNTSNKHHGFVSPLSRQPSEKRNFLEKKESKMFIKRETWNKKLIPLIPKDDPSSDQESVGSNESYHSIDLVPVALKLPIKSFAGELMRRQSKSVIEKEESVTISIASTIPEIPIEIPIQIPNQRLQISAVAPGTSLLVPGSDTVHVRRASFSANLFKPQLDDPSKKDVLPPMKSSTLVPQAALSLGIPTAHTTLSTAQATAIAAKKRQSVSFNAEPTLPPQVPLGTEPSSFDPFKAPDAKTTTSSLQRPKGREGGAVKIIPKSEVEESIDAWKRLKKEARGSIKDGSAVQTKFSGIGEVVNVMKDLKNLGMDSNLVQEVGMPCFTLLFSND
jgi:hypothetical protein